MQGEQDNDIVKIAVVGMAGRFPGARSIDEYWKNLIGEVESIRFFSDEQWEAAAHLRAPRDDSDNAEVIRARAVLDDAELFDAEFFGYRPREASIMDPQQRLFLEQSWAALEHAGYDASRFDGAIGVYGGVSRNTYLLNNVQHVVGRADSLDDRQTETGNERDYVASRVAYQLDLHGPAIAVQSACSTSLLAVHYACQDLLNFQCDIALAGGASVRVPQVEGYVHTETGILSRDGRCRPFDRDASGTNVGDGVGIVVLKRLDEAIRDGDMIWAVVAGSAVNNDGRGKLSFMAPSIEGQAEVIACALSAADVSPKEISYVECHGTGTPLGDPIEVEGLRQAFGERSGPPCGIGSVKSNIGHLDAAAGIAGFIKLVLALHHKKIPATLNFRSPNPECGFEDGTFRVVAKTTDWEQARGIRCAGVSSFGVGGTNVHAILQEAPPREPIAKTESHPVLLPVSAKVEAAVADRWRDLADYFETDSCHASLQDIAYTLTFGRKPLEQRSFAVCENKSEAAASARDRVTRTQSKCVKSDLSVAFMFPGQGAQCTGMGRELYANNEVFRAELDRCCDIAASFLDRDLRSMIWDETIDDSLNETRYAQPAIFAIEYSLAQWWMSLGVEPQAMIGHSIGEYVAACLAGVFSLEDAIELVCARGRLMQSAQRGAMLAVLLPEQEARRYTSKTLSMAAVNAPDSCVLSGDQNAIAELDSQLEVAGIACRRLQTSHAFHSASMEPILEEFHSIATAITMRAPTRPFVSNLTGERFDSSKAIDADYWTRHLRETVCFQKGIETLLESGINTFIEIGPGRSLSGAVKRIDHRDIKEKAEVITSLPNPASGEMRQVLEAFGSAWCLGADFDWGRLLPRTARRVPLPTYPFQRSRYWVEPKIDDKQNVQQGTIVIAPVPPASTAATVPPASSTASDSPVNREPATANQSSENRVQRVLNELLEIFRNMSGLEIADSDTETRFQDLGFDSLFLAQANADLRKKFKVRVGFRQLLEEAPTPAALARFIESAMPPEEPDLGSNGQPHEPSDQTQTEFPQANVPVESGSCHSIDPLSQPIASIRALVAGTSSGLIDVAQKHLELMEAQIRLLKNATGSTLTGSIPAMTTRTLSPSPAENPIASKRSGGFEPIRVTVGAAPTPKPNSAISDRQKEGISTLMKRYCERTRNSKNFAETARPRLADNRAIVGYRNAWKDIAYQVVTAGSQGSRLQDIDGNEYVDLMNCFGANLLGHRFQPIVEAIEDLLHQGFEVGPQNRLAYEVAEKVCAMTGAERLTFAHTGCEAVQYAIRMARAATGRKKVMFFDGDVHGRGDLFIARSFEANGEIRTMPTAPGVPSAHVSETMVLQYGSQRALEVLRSMGDDIAAVLVECVRTRNPDLQPIEFLREVRAITQQRGICLIFDEVVTGFRVHPGGTQAYFDIDADIATYGKVLGGGLPIGAVAGRREFLDFADGGLWSFHDDTVPESPVTRVGGTMVKHPLAMAAAKALLETLEKAGPDLQRELNGRTTRFAEHVNAKFQALGTPIHVEQFSSFFKPIFFDGPEFETLFYCHLRDRGIHAYVDFPCFFSAAHTEEDINKVADAIVESAEEMMHYGLLSARPPEVPALGVNIANKDQGIVTGSMPLLPNQHRFLVERECAHANSWGIFGVRPCRVRLDEESLRAAFALLIRQHDALRMKLVTQPSGWDVFVDEPHAKLPFSVHRIAEIDSDQAEQLLQQEVTRLRSAISLEEGPLVRMALFDFGDDAPQRVFLMVSHLAADGLSWARLWEDIEAAYEHIRRGESWHPAKTDSFRTWAHRLDSLAQEQKTIDKADDWIALPWESVGTIRRDFDVSVDKNVNGAVGVLQLHLDADISKSLDRVRIDYRADLLVAAIARAVADWSEIDTVLLDVLGHGREEDLFENADVSRTVGFFAWYTPHVIRMGEVTTDDQWASTILPQIDSIRRLDGMTYDLLRYSCRDEEVQRRMQNLPRAEILVNWQGRFDGVFPKSQLFDAKDPGLASDSPSGKRYYLLSIRGDIIDNRWVVTFVYSRNFHQESTIGQLADRVQELLTLVGRVSR